MAQFEEVIAMDGPLHQDLVKWWEEWLPRIRSIDDLYESPLHPLQRKEEAKWMLDVARMYEPSTVMEVGADKGGGAFQWLSIGTVETLVVNEIRGTPYAELWARVYDDRDFLFSPKSSYDPATVREVEAFLRERKIDVLFLDGDKSFFDRDFHCYSRLMASKSVAFFHDITDPAPREAYDRVCAMGYEHEERVDTSEVALFLTNEKFGVPVASSYEGWMRHWRGRSCGVGAVYMGGRL